MRCARPFLAVLCSVLVAALACAGPTAEAEGYPPQMAAPGPPPPGTPPPPPNSEGVPDGQWAYTADDGWVWMPYGDPYTFVPPDGTGEPLEYGFVNDYGWTWIAAPWVWGIGPSPWFGRRGPRPYAWYRHGWWRTPQRWRYQPAPARDEVARRGIRPAPQSRRGAPAERRDGEQRRGEGGSGGTFEPRGGGERGPGERGGGERGGGERGGGERGEEGGRGGSFGPGGGRDGR